MLATAIIVFREILEAALIIGIVCAATRGVRHRNLWVLAGIAAGVAGAVVVAALADVILEAADGLGQEILNATILFIAVAMLAWHNIWMASHARELTEQMNSMGAAVKSGAEPVTMLLVVIGLAVLREGSEVVLFLHGLAASGDSWANLLSGSATGLATGMGVGFALYFGLLRIPTRHLFTVTGWMILLLAAGMASQGAKYLVQADILPAFGDRLWDTSALLGNQSIPGKLLHTLAGYDATPSGMQLVFYVITVIVIGTGMKIVNIPRTLPAAATVVALALLLPVGQEAKAGPADTVYSPFVEVGETELEMRGGMAFDHDNSFPEDESRQLKFALGRGVTDWWFTELYTEYSKDKGVHSQFEGVEWENRFQLTERGEYWLDVGFLASYFVPNDRHDADVIEYGPLLHKDFEHFEVNTNITFVHDVGSHATHETDLEYSWDARWFGNPKLQWGLQGFGAAGKVNQFHSSNEQEHRIGPAVFGKIPAGNKQFVQYDAGVSVGLTGATADATLRFNVEYEFMP